MRKVVILGSIFSIVCLHALAADTKSIMDEILVSMQEILPLSLQSDAFYASSKQQSIQKTLDRLAASADALEQHVKAADASMQIVSRSLAQDARDAAAWFREGRIDESRYMVHNITENCISCHLKGSSKNQFPGLESFFASVETSKLNPLDRARLQIALRQFDEAMKTFEGLIADKSIEASELIFMDAITDYLKLAVRVQGDFARARKTLEQFLSTRTVPLFVKKQVSDWISALSELEKQSAKNAKPTLASARNLVKQAQERMKYPRDRDGLIHFVAASGQLRKVLDEKKLPPKDLAEAYYLLGMIEEAIGRSFWVSESQALLEAAIRTAPKAPVSAQAYKMLEESIYVDYSGSSGTHIPSEVQERLEELRKLMSK